MPNSLGSKAISIRFYPFYPAREMGWFNAVTLYLTWRFMVHTQGSTALFSGCVYGYADPAARAGRWVYSRPRPRSLRCQPDGSLLRPSCAMKVKRLNVEIAQLQLSDLFLRREWEPKPRWVKQVNPGSLFPPLLASSQSRPVIITGKIEYRQLILPIQAERFSTDVRQGQHNSLNPVQIELKRSGTHQSAAVKVAQCWPG